MFEVALFIMLKLIFAILDTTRRVKNLYNIVFITQHLILIVKLSSNMTIHNNFNFKGRNQLFNDEAQAY